MSLSAARTQMCVRADSLRVIDRAAPSGSCAVLYRGKALQAPARRGVRPGHLGVARLTTVRPRPMRGLQMRRSRPLADDRASHG